MPVLHPGVPRNHFRFQWRGKSLKLFHAVIEFQHMIKRFYESLLLEMLGLFPVVALVGPRQVGESTLVTSAPGLVEKMPPASNAGFPSIQVMVPAW
jgi:hypothetical protein